MTELSDLETKVKEAADPNQAAVALVNGLADLLDGLQQDPLAIKGMAAKLRENAGTIGAAVTANAAQLAPRPGAFTETEGGPQPTSPGPETGKHPKGYGKPKG